MAVVPMLQEDAIEEGEEEEEEEAVEEAVKQHLKKKIVSNPDSTDKIVVVVLYLRVLLLQAKKQAFFQACILFSRDPYQHFLIWKGLFFESR